MQTTRSVRTPTNTTKRHYPMHFRACRFHTSNTANSAHQQINSDRQFVGIFHFHEQCNNKIMYKLHSDILTTKPRSQHLQTISDITTF